ncbi:MAG: beta-ketoacyl synthase chain length factor [Chitinophagaceae bacterium]
MFYIHQTTCISPQQTFLHPDLHQFRESVENKLKVMEPEYPGIPPGILRRMGKAVRIGVGAALPLVQQVPVAGIVIGTANGGMEDCIRFLNQIIQYEEGMLTPGNFVQSTPNSIAAQLGLLGNNKGHNSTHVHRGLAFENALLDVAMLSREHPGKNYLLGAVDEISTYNYNIDFLGGWYKKEALASKDLFSIDSQGSIAGEGAAMFIINDKKESAQAYLQDISTLHTERAEAVTDRLQYFMNKNLNDGENIDLLISGESGDNRFVKFYNACEALLGNDVPIARFKHMSGEFATASAIALWLGCQALGEQALPTHMLKSNPIQKNIKRILIYNNYKGIQHSFILLSKP